MLYLFLIEPNIEQKVMNEILRKYYVWVCLWYLVLICGLFLDLILVRINL